MQLLYKVVSKEEVNNYEKLHKSIVSEMTKYGFIHLSDRYTIGKIIKRKYNNDQFYVLILDSDVLGESNINYEVSGDGERYPHLYDTKGLFEDCNKYVPASQLLKFVAS